MAIYQKNFQHIQTFKNKLIIKTQGLEILFSMLKFGWIVNTSKLNDIGS